MNRYHIEGNWTPPRTTQWAQLDALSDDTEVEDVIDSNVDQWVLLSLDHSLTAPRMLDYERSWENLND